jgi:hypothetical protein
MGERYLASRPGLALLAAALLLAPPALGAPRCGTEADQSVFEIEALKAELMVIGITCGAEERYNDFVRRYQPQLAANAQAFGQYFTRTRGRAGQRANDAYITNLAQARASEAQMLGSDFCPRNTGLFGEVMALPSPAELPAYAAGKDLFPASFSPCEGTPPPRAAPPPPARRGGARPGR